MISKRGCQNITETSKTQKMAESAENAFAVLQPTGENKENEDKSFEPEPKKLRLDDSATILDHKLEDRLSGILCCAVCLDLPNSCFQVFTFFSFDSFLHVYVESYMQFSIYCIQNSS